MSTTKSQRANPLDFKLSILWIVISIALHAYLSFVHYNQLSNSFSKSFCDLSATFSCSAVATSKFSMFLNLPVALWGLFTNILLGLFLFESSRSPDSDYPRYTMWLSSLVLLASIAMAAISLLYMNQYCPFCIGLYVFSLLSFVNIWRYLGNPFWKTLVPDFISLFTDRMGILTLFLLIPVGAWLFDQVILDRFNKAVGGKDIGTVINQRVNEWKANIKYEIDTKHAIHLTSKSAPIQIVEFADFMCSHCQDAAPVFEELIASNGNVEFLFMTFPLDGECNADIPKKWGVSCRYAKALYCANIQGKGKQAHLWLFKEAPGTIDVRDADQKNSKMVTQLSLNESTFKSCIDSSDTHKAVSDMAKEGVRVQIQGTPTVFLNGRMLPAAHVPAVLKSAIKEIN